MFKFAVKYGGIGAAVTIALTIVFLLFDTILPQWITIAIMLGVLVWGQIAYRRNSDLAISYGETFGLGMLVLLMFAATSTVYMFFHWNFIDPEMTARVLEQAEEAIQQQGLSGAQLEAAMNIQKMMVGPIASPAMGFFTSLLLGAVLALITSIFTRKAAPA